MTIASALNKTPLPLFEAQLLLAHVLKKDRAFLLAFAETKLTEQQREAFEALASRREKGEPIAYLLGNKEFWSLNLHTTPAVLIPRSDTEIIVETILTLYANINRLHLAELGTGSGAIALALASEKPQWNIIATDKSSAALAIAKGNAKTHQLDDIRFYQGDWCNALPLQKFDVIVSNPPYIRSDDLHLERGDLPYEPRAALEAGKDGLRCFHAIISQAKSYLTPNGRLILEHGYDQSEAVHDIFSCHGYTDPHSVEDLAGYWRVAYASYPS